MYNVSNNQQTQGKTRAVIEEGSRRASSSYAQRISNRNTHRRSTKLPSIHVARTLNNNLNRIMNTVNDTMNALSDRVDSGCEKAVEFLHDTKAGINQVIEQAGDLLDPNPQNEVEALMQTLEDNINNWGNKIKEGLNQFKKDTTALGKILSDCIEIIGQLIQSVKDCIKSIFVEEESSKMTSNSNFCDRVQANRNECKNSNSMSR